jgi:hypothetical protein
MNPHVDEILAGIRILGPLFDAVRSRRAKAEPQAKPVVNPLEIHIIAEAPSPRAAIGLFDVDPVLSNELQIIWTELLVARDNDLERLFFRTKQLLSRHPEHAEVLLVQSKIIAAIKSSRNVKIFTCLMLMLWLFVVLRGCEKVARSRIMNGDGPGPKGLGLLSLESQ